MFYLNVTDIVTGRQRRSEVEWEGNGRIFFININKYIFFKIQH